MSKCFQSIIVLFLFILFFPSKILSYCFFAISTAPISKGTKILPKPPIKAGMQLNQLTFVKERTISLPLILILIGYFTYSL